MFRDLQDDNTSFRQEGDVSQKKMVPGLLQESAAR